MEIQEFVASVLMQLENGLTSATDQSKDKRFGFDKAVQFDLAVTHTSSRAGDIGAKAKGNIVVVDFDIGGKGKVAASQEVVQRVKFGVYAYAKESGTGVVRPRSVQRFDDSIQGFGI